MYKNPKMNADYSYVEVANRMPDDAQASGIYFLRLEYAYKPLVYDFGSIFIDNKITHTDACGWTAVSGAIEMMVKFDKDFCKRTNAVHQARDEILKDLHSNERIVPGELKTFSGTRSRNCRITDEEFQTLAIVLGIKINVVEMRETRKKPELYVNRTFGFQHFASQISIFQNGHSHFVVLFDACSPDHVGQKYRELITNYDEIPDHLMDAPINLSEPELDPNAYGDLDKDVDYEDVDDEDVDYERRDRLVQTLADSKKALDEFNRNLKTTISQGTVDADLAFILQHREVEELAKTAKQIEDDASWAERLSRLDNEKAKLDSSAELLRKMASKLREPLATAEDEYGQFDW